MPFDSPLYKAGVAEGDQIVSLAGVEVTTAQAVQEVLARYQPGARLALRFVRRSGEAVTIGTNIEEDPRVEIVPAEEHRRHGDPGTAAGPAGVAGRESEVRHVMRMIQSAVAAAVVVVAAATAASAQVSNAELAAVPRVTLAEFKKLHAAKQILAIDVRDPHALRERPYPRRLERLVRGRRDHGQPAAEGAPADRRLLRLPGRDDRRPGGHPADAGGREAHPGAGRRLGRLDRRRR